MNPTQAVLADIELTGIVANDHGVAEKAMGFDTAPQRGFGSDEHRIGIDLERRDSELVEMGAPGCLIGKASVGMLDQASDHMGGQRAFARVGKRLVIDHVIAVASAQQFEEVEAALESRRAKPGEVCVAYLCAETVGGLVTRAGVVNRDPGGAR